MGTKTRSALVTGEALQAQAAFLFWDAAKAAGDAVVGPLEPDSRALCRRINGLYWALLMESPSEGIQEALRTLEAVSRDCTPEGRF